MFIEGVIIFEVFAISTCDAIFVMFLWPLGASWGPLGPPFESPWPLAIIWGFLGTSWGGFGGVLGIS